MLTMIGHVSQERYEQIITRGRELVELQTRSQFELGDLALEIEPMQPHGGGHPDRGEALFGVLAPARVRVTSRKVTLRDCRCAV
ncbi:hypothetical protein [Nonomuraea aurantiaca]|uniref:hypothetical protein n=1 Tax=Nonomuraea aurantiaca TaxID=2878562 RepID=UPI001CD9BAD8|nr:hypothetical protein [Nonomuraea aurantiaca]MCA2220736.1 hypothetical protein [Nonomuraea aurantiaca]